METELIMVLASIVMAFATVVYAFMTYKLVRRYDVSIEIMRKDRERPQIENLVKKVLTPFIEQIDRQKKSLEKEDYGWWHKEKKSRYADKLRAYGDVRIVFNDLLRKFPNLKSMIEEYNENCSKLQQKLRSLDEVIYTPSFRGKCCNFIEKYNESGEFTLSEGWVKRSPEYFVQFIIDNTKKVESYGREYFDFWEKHGNELLKIREEKEIRNKINEICQISQEIREISKKIREKLTQLKERFWIEYSLVEEGAFGIYK